MRAVPLQPCLALLHAFEKGPGGSFAAVPYQDPAGYWTNGWGHRCAADAAEVNQDQADVQALLDLDVAAVGVAATLGDVIIDSLTVGQYAALIDFTFNEGRGRFAGSTLAHCVKVGALHLVPDEFMKWVFGRVNGIETVLEGLVLRRKAEVNVWLA
jgi:lysozyme